MFRSLLTPIVFFFFFSNTALKTLQLCFKDVSARPLSHAPLGPHGAVHCF